MDLNNFFYAKNVAIIGASHEPNKIGHVILRNFVAGHFEGNVYPINPSQQFILNRKCYASVKDIESPVDLAVIAVPASAVLKVMEECGKKKVRDIVVVTSGFEEIGNFKLRDALLKIVNKYKMNVIGPNCLGVYNAVTDVDTLFLPRNRLKRPKSGGISFVSQSGALGSAVLDLAAEKGYGISKFISYGNAINVSESDVIEYLGSDEQTKVICLYIEAVRDGKRFLEVCSKVSKVKPIIAIKGGITEAGSKAALSHTGSLAGSAEIYHGAFKQAGIILAESLEDLFDYARVLEYCVKPHGNKVQVITNGGGYGILCSDEISKQGLSMAELKGKTKEELKKKFPPLVIVKNPIDLIGDADTARYQSAIHACMIDDNVDILLIVTLYQTPLLGPDVVDVLKEYGDMRSKPIIVIATGSEPTETLKKHIEEGKIPCFSFPTNAVRAITKLVEYHKLE